MRMETFSDGTISGEGELADGRKIGQWTFFYRSGAIKGQGSFRLAQAQRSIRTRSATRPVDAL